MRYRSEKGKDHGGVRRGNYFQVDQNDPLESTAQRIADQYNIGEATVKRAEKFADGIDNIAKARPELKQEILQG